MIAHMRFGDRVRVSAAFTDAKSGVDAQIPSTFGCTTKEHTIITVIRILLLQDTMISTTSKESGQKHGEGRKEGRMHVWTDSEGL